MIARTISTSCCSALVTGFSAWVEESLSLSLLLELTSTAIEVSKGHTHQPLCKARTIPSILPPSSLLLFDIFPYFFCHLSTRLMLKSPDNSFVPNDVKFSQSGLAGLLSITLKRALPQHPCPARHTHASRSLEHSLLSISTIVHHNHDQADVFQAQARNHLTACGYAKETATRRARRAQCDDLLKSHASVRHLLR